ncbi:hypothetical protein [Phascolarctobacterium faecium]|uniref:hypothetical protein n=1 Tax=Phascolarctobacterium faecium TaxID=33025 RepID=UPI003AB3608D
MVWRAAGLTPPPMNDVQRENFMAKTLEQYKYTQVNDWAEAVEWVANNNTRWATWFDINTALSIVRQNKIGAEKKAIERNSKAANEFVKKLFADLAAGKTFGELRQPISEKVRAAAKRIFPDADDSFIKRNYNDISFIADVERKCAECINTVDCPYSGHQPFLRVDKESGFTYVVADRERCYKYHPLVPDVVPKRSACRQGELAKV